MSEDTCASVRRVLLDSLLGIKCSDEDVDEVWGDVSLSKVNVLNWASLLTSGIGNDFIYLNESMAEGKTLLDFDTLYDYDYADYLFQEKANRQEFSNYKGSDYYAFKHASWVRLLIDDQFYYATFISLATYIHDEIDTAGSDYIDQLIPHEYVDGKDNGKQEKGGVIWDMKLDAKGLEGQLDELRRGWYTYLQERWLALSKTNCDLAAGVYMQDKNWDDDPHRYFIFNNAVSLKKIRWRHFLSDCEPLMANFSVVQAELEREISQAKSYLTDSHRDIMKNFDPKVVQLRKKRKVIVLDGVLDDLSRIDSED